MSGTAARPRLTSRQIDRYIFRQLAIALVAVTGGLAALIWLTQSLRFVELVVNRGLAPRVFVELTALLIPNFIAVILPITTFVVVQFVYQRLSADREITVMRAAGISPLTVSRPALMLAVMSVGLCFVLNLSVVPASFASFRQFQFEIRNRVAAFLLQEGVFTPVSDDLTVYIRVRDPDGGLRGILVDDARNKNSHATILAQRGLLVPGKDGAPRVVLYNGSRQELDRQTGRLNVLTFAENALDLEQGGHGDEQRFRDATEMSLGELLHPPPGLVPERDIPKLRVEGHRRLSSPFTALSFTLIGLVAVLQGNFRRHGNVLRPLGAVALVVGLLAAGLAAVNLAQRHPSLLPLLWLQAIGPGLIAAWLLAVPRQFRLATPSMQRSAA